ncbi:MAG: hypothetical protein BHV95_01490 [Clostridiales bacterium Nov_37_41]|nr:MAG: hypothetical protein BHV95_01490 [Clostridiales bacterium Nov_37_41]
MSSQIASFKIGLSSFGLMVVVSYVSDNICRICQMDKMNCISNNHTIKNNGMQFICEEDWKKWLNM